MTLTMSYYTVSTPSSTLATPDLLRRSVLSPPYCTLYARLYRSATTETAASTSCQRCRAHKGISVLSHPRGSSVRLDRSAPKLARRRQRARACGRRCVGWRRLPLSRRVHLRAQYRELLPKHGHEHADALHVSDSDALVHRFARRCLACIRRIGSYCPSAGATSATPCLAVR